MDEHNAEPELIDGTFCTECYMVFAHNEGYKIGIKPLFDAGYGASYIGFRIRAVPPEDVDADFTGGESISEHFPGFQFGKVASQRNSLMGGLYVNRSDKQKDDIMTFLVANRIVGKTISALKEHLGDVPLIHEDSLYTWLTDEYNALIDKKCIEDKSTEEAMPSMEGTVIYMDKYKAEQAFQGKTEDEEEPSESQM